MRKPILRQWCGKRVGGRAKNSRRVILSEVFRLKRNLGGAGDWSECEQLRR